MCACMYVPKMLCHLYYSLPPHRDEAEMDYLKIAQDLEMYGVSYFAITVSESIICLDVYSF